MTDFEWQALWALVTAYGADKIKRAVEDIAADIAADAEDTSE